MKKLLVFFIFVIILPVFVFVLKLQTSNPEVSKVQQIQTITKLQGSPYDPCKNQGLPAGSYNLSGGVCYPADEYAKKVIEIAKLETDTGDKTENVLIKDIFKKEGQIYIKADHIDFPVCNQQTEGTRKDSSLPDCNPNGFYLENSSPELKTYILDSGVKIRLMEDYGSIPDAGALTPTEFMNGGNKYGQKFYRYDTDSTETHYPPFILIFKNSKIIYIHQFYLP